MQRILVAMFGMVLVVIAAAATTAADAPDLKAVESKPLYKCSEAEVGSYIGHVQQTEPDLRKRIVRLARKNALFCRPRTNLCGGNMKVTDR